MGVCWSGSQLVVVVDWCWWLTAGRRQQSDDRMLEEEEHGSCTFCVVAPAVNENMAADRNIQFCWVGEGGGMVNCLLWRGWRTRTGVYALRCLRCLRQMGIVQMSTVKHVVLEEGMGNTDFFPVYIVQLVLLLTWIVIQMFNVNHGL